MATRRVNADLDLTKNQVINAVFENKDAATMEVSDNEQLGRFYYDTTSNTFKYWNGSKWIAGAEGALTPIGVIDYSLSTETATKKKTVPTGLTGNLCNKGDTWFVAKTGEYSFTDSDGNATKIILNVSDFLFCVESDPKGKTNAKWSYVKAGEDIAIYEFKYSDSAKDTTSWTFVNTLMSSNCFWQLYRETSVTSGTTTTVTRTAETADIQIIEANDGTTSTYSIKVDFGRKLDSDDVYKLIVGTL